MKKIPVLILLGTMFCTVANGQNDSQLLNRNKAFTSAEASQEMYHAIYQLDSNDPKIIEKAIRNIKNALDDPRLKGKLQIELIAFSGGTDAYLKSSKYEDDLKSLINKGVIIAQCENTLRERHIAKEDIFDFVALVPTGNGELIIREAEGWAIIKP